MQATLSDLHAGGFRKFLFSESSSEKKGDFLNFLFYQPIIDMRIGMYLL